MATSDKAQEWCEKAGEEIALHVDKHGGIGRQAASLLVARHHQEGCGFVMPWTKGYAEGANKCIKVEQAARELVAEAKVAREACAAAFRVAQQTSTWYQLETAMEKAGVQKGFGKRLDTAIAKMKACLH